VPALFDKPEKWSESAVLKSIWGDMRLGRWLGFVIDEALVFRLGGGDLWMR